MNAACFPAVSYLDLVLLQQAEFDFLPHPQLVFDCKCMNHSFLTNVNGVGRPSGFLLPKSHFKKPCERGLVLFQVSPLVLSPLKAGGLGEECICLLATGLCGLSTAASSNIWLCKSWVTGIKRSLLPGCCHLGILVVGILIFLHFVFALVQVLPLSCKLCWLSWRIAEKAFSLLPLLPLQLICQQDLLSCVMPGSEPGWLYQLTSKKTLRFISLAYAASCSVYLKNCSAWLLFLLKKRCSAYRWNWVWLSRRNTEIPMILWTDDFWSVVPWTKLGPTSR